MLFERQLFQNAAVLHDAGVDKPSRLLAQGATPEGRAELCAVSGLSAELVEELPSAETVSGWVAQAEELPRGVYY